MARTPRRDRAMRAPSRTDRSSPLRIGVIAPPWFELPPKGYGGIEWMCYWLVQGLVERGHDVILVGSGTNHTGAHFAQTYAEPPSHQLGQSVPEIVHAAAARRLLGDLDLDVVHDHSFAGPLLAPDRAVPTVITAHGPVDGELASYYRELSAWVSMVAISDAQRRAGPALPWAATIHNSIPVADYPFSGDKDDYALFLGRMSPEKGAHLAIEVARRAGRRLILAGKCNEPPEFAYFEKEVAPRLHSGVEWIGEAATDKKKALLEKASCLIFPIQWPEPFGIVMVEAMACGTPVVALNRGSVPEVVEDGVTGYICSDLADLPDAMRRADSIDPHACRTRAERFFDSPKMVAAYEAVYRKAIRAHKRRHRAARDAVVLPV